MGIYGSRVPGCNSKQSQITLRNGATTGKSDEIIALIDNGILTNIDIVIDDDGCSAIHYAAKNGRTAIVTLLESKGADINLKSNFGLTPLHFAVRRQHPNVVQKLLELGADVHIRDRHDWTALHYAAKAGDRHTFRELRGKGAEVEARTTWGWTALHVAAMHGKKAILAELLRQGEFVHLIDVEDRSEHTVIDLAKIFHKDVVSLIEDSKTPTDFYVRPERAGGYPGMTRAPYKDQMAPSLAATDKKKEMEDEIMEIGMVETQIEGAQAGETGKGLFWARVTVDELPVRKEFSTESPVHTACMSQNVKFLVGELREGQMKVIHKDHGWVPQKMDGVQTYRIVEEDDSAGQSELTTNTSLPE